MAASENQKYLAKLTVGIFRAGRTPAQKSETEVLENTSCEAYRAYPFSVPGISGTKFRNAWGATQTWFSEKQTF